MNERCYWVGAVGFVVCLGVGSAWGAGPVGTAFTYQGNLMEFGELVNGSADFEFTVWDALVAGNQVGAVVSVDAVEVVSGQFSVEVDFGVDPYTANQALWLEIDVRSPAGQGQFETLAPRQELTPTPFSLATRGINVNAADEVGIGTTNPQAKLHVGGTPGVDGIMFPDGTLQTSAGGGGGGNTLDQAYDQGGPGTGRIITADTGSIRINGDGLLLDGPFSSSNHSLNIFTITEGDAVHANNTGAGHAGFFFSNGPGIGVESTNARAGEFQIGPGTNNEAAVYAKTRGTGLAGQFIFDNTAAAGTGILATSNGTSGSSALSGSARGSAHGLAVTTFGSGRGVLAQVFQPGTGNAGYFRIRNSNSSAAALYCETDGSGLAFHANGTARVDVLEVMGADIAEKFPVSERVTPGTVMEIDPENAGKLRMARGAYNRRVAGVVSGAGGLPVGAVLGNLPGNEDAPAVALSGRVWVKCDASRSAIQIGDLLTTADKAGCAMAVADHMRANGATLGKAMTSLDKGEAGLVLVLVNLQ